MYFFNHMKFIKKRQTNKIYFKQQQKTSSQDTTKYPMLTYTKEKRKKTVEKCIFKTKSE